MLTHPGRGKVVAKAATLAAMRYHTDVIIGAFGGVGALAGSQKAMPFPVLSIPCPCIALPFHCLSFTSHCPLAAFHRPFTAFSLPSR